MSYASLMSLQLIFITEAFYPPGITAVKFSVLLLYHRIFPSERFRKILWIVGGIILCYTIALEACIMFQCSPISGVWDPAVHARAKCIPLHVVTVSMASMNVLTDITTLCLPLPLIWRLQIDRARKFQLVAIFLLGSL